MADDFVNRAILVLREAGVEPDKCELVQRGVLAESFVLHTDKSGLGWIWIPASHSVPWHKHNVDKTVRVIKGAGGAVIGEPPVEGPCRILKPGSTLHVPANSWHRIGASQTGMLLSFAAAEIETQWYTSDADKTHPKPVFLASTVRIYSAIKHLLLASADDTVVQQIIQNACTHKKRKRSDPDTWDRDEPPAKRTNMK